MASPIIPKSDARQITTLIHGYGAVPIVECPDGRVGWAIPGQDVTFDYEEALTYAKQLDEIIRKSLKTGKYPKFH